MIDRDLMSVPAILVEACGAMDCRTIQGMPAESYAPAILGLAAEDPHAAIAVAHARFHGRPIVHELRPTAIDRVHTTDLHVIPAVPPRLMAGAWCVTVGDTLREGLWEDDFARVTSVSGTPLPDGSCLMVIEHGATSVGLRWRPTWGAPMRATDDLRLADVGSQDPTYEGSTDNAGRNAIRFTTVLACLLDAERTPLRVRDEDRKPPRAQRRRGEVEPGRGEWTQRYVSLDPRSDPVAVVEHATEAARQAGDLEAIKSVITGHMKWQAYGPGHTERKLIYVEEYAARRWIAPAPVRVVVK